MKPPYLQKDDKIAVVAPSGRVFKHELEQNLQFIISLGLQPILGKNLFNDFFEGYHYAGTVKQRFDDFQWAIDDEEIKAIWCARGGYGAVQIVDILNWKQFKVQPKWLIGYSDITVFHNALNNLDVESVHGLTIKKLDVEYTNETFKTLETALFGRKLCYKLKHHPLNKPGNIQGKLVGGNLSLLYSQVGSRTEIAGDNLILFIEDWNENWYHLDRMLTSLKRSGLLARIQGLIVGSFTKMDTEDENPNFQSDFDPTSYDIIRKFMDNYKFPICFCFPAGHIGDNRALRLGSTINLSVTSEKSTIEFH